MGCKTGLSPFRVKKRPDCRDCVRRRMKLVSVTIFLFLSAIFHWIMIKLIMIMLAARGDTIEFLLNPFHCPLFVPLYFRLLLLVFSLPLFSSCILFPLYSHPPILPSSPALFSIKIDKFLDSHSQVAKRIFTSLRLAITR